MKKFIPAAKLFAIIAFGVTLFSTYYLRSQVLILNEIRFESDNARAERQMQDLEESYPRRLEEHAIAVKNYELQVEHYEEMLALYKSDYDAYAQRLKDKYTPPNMPRQPNKPTPPEQTDELMRINAKFRQQQFDYFRSSWLLNWISCVAAISLTGCLMFLIMFEEGNQRFIYLAVLMLSFVFMIGPSFHSIMSAIVGFLNAPSMR